MRSSTWRIPGSFVSGVCFLMASVLAPLFLRRYHRHRRLQDQPLESNTLPLSLVIKSSIPAIPMHARPSLSEDDESYFPPRGNPWAHELDRQPSHLPSASSDSTSQPRIRSPELLHYHDLISNLPVPSGFPSGSDVPVVSTERKIYRQGTHIKSVLEEQSPCNRWRRRMIVYANDGNGPELRGWGGHRRPQTGTHNQEAVEGNEG